MANYTNEIQLMMQKFLIKTLAQDREGVCKNKINHKLNLTEMLIINMLAVDEARISTIIDSLEINRNKANTTISKLIIDKIISKRVDPADGRGQIVALTSYGRSIHDKLQSHLQEEINFILQDVTINEEKAILKFLSKYVQYHTGKFDLNVGKLLPPNK